MALEVELARFQELLPDLLSQGEGQYAVLYGTALVGIFSSNDQAYTAGLERAGLAPFLLRRIQKTQPKIFLPTLFKLQQHG